ncbi:hypothetical protein KBH77_00195 [Patescibacteria group bacterium]|nr:hypothetical protein [Patescibacteria group bacterium]
MSNLYGLTNEELLFIKVLIDEKKKLYNNAFEKKHLVKVDTNNNNELLSIDLDDNKIQVIKKQEWFELLKSISFKVNNISSFLFEIDKYKNLYNKMV